MISTIIIDDHSLFNDGLHLILKESGKFKIMAQVYDSREALSKCFTLRPDLVVVDYNMPHLNGVEVIKQIKSLNYDFKTVVISMYADKKELALFEALGVDGYFTKTTPSDELVSSLLRIIAGERVFVSHHFDKTILQNDTFAKSHYLTKREREILKLIKAGYSTEQAAEMLHLSFYTVETHRKNINQKMGFKTKQAFYDFLKNFEE
ncbi:MAG: response regulator [Runella sp.]